MIISDKVFWLSAKTLLPILRENFIYFKSFLSYTPILSWNLEENDGHETRNFKICVGRLKWLGKYSIRNTHSYDCGKEIQAAYLSFLFTEENLQSAGRKCVVIW